MVTNGPGAALLTLRTVYQHRMPLIDAPGDLRVPPRAKYGRGAGVRVHTDEVRWGQRKAAVRVADGLGVAQEEGALGLVETPLRTTEYQGAELEPGVHIGEEGRQPCSESPVLEVEQANRWRKGEELYLPLYEGKMVQAFDHRAASVVVNPENLNRPAQPREASLDEHANPNWLPDPQYWVLTSECGWTSGSNWVLGFKEITAPTNARTFIASLFPEVGFGNKVPILKPETEDRNEWLLAANLNAMIFDFVVRQKIQGQTLNLFIVEQLPVIASDDYDRQFGNAAARELVRDHVLRLTYTAHDMAPFARDLGYDGPPFIWDEEERRHLRARLDALYFHLYGISREDADYILNTFPIVRRQDEAEFGAYRTRDLILAYMNALATGDTKTMVAV